MGFEPAHEASPPNEPPLTLLAAIAIGLAGYRVAVFLVLEAGPFNIAGGFRSWLGVRPGRQNFAQELMGCVWCCSVYTTMAAWMTWTFAPNLVYLIAAMGVALALERSAQGR